MKIRINPLCFMITAAFFLSISAGLAPLAEAQSGPILDVSPDTVRFDSNFCYGTPYDPPVSPRGMFVHNAGDGDMTWSGVAGADWVDFEPKSGGNFDSVLVWIVWQNLPEGSIPQSPGDTVMLFSDITITSPEASNSPQAAIIQLALTCSEPMYYLMVHPTYFDFSVPPGDMFESSFFVYEANGHNIEFSCYNRSTWLILPQTFAALYTPDTVRFTIDTDTLPSGVYYDTISVVTSEQPSNSPRNIPVRLHVTGDQVILVAEPDAFTYTLQVGQWGGGDSLYIYEAGGRSINFWTYNESSWLYLDTMGPSPLYTPSVLYVNVSAENLDPGVYSDTISVMSDEADNSPLLVPVSLIVEGGQVEHRILTAPTYFSFNLEPDEFASADLAIFESHGDAVHFAIWTEAPWVSITIEEPSITPTNATVTVSADSLLPGFYVDTIFIYPTDVTVAQAAVPVYLEVGYGAPRLVSVPEYFHFTMRAGDSLESGLWVYEASGDTVPYSIQTMHNSPWLRLYVPFNGDLMTPDSVRFGIFTEGLDPGTYGDTIILFNPLDNMHPYYEVIVPVILSVYDDTPQPEIRTNPQSLTFTIGPDTVGVSTLLVYESGGDTVGFHYYSSEPWLVVNPLGMPPFMTPMTMPVTVSSSGTDPGIYTDTIFIGSADDTLSYPTWAVPVTMVVDPGGTFLHGDANGDKEINIGDVISLIDYIFRHGSAPDPLESGDANCNGRIEIGDAVHIVSFIFKSGPPPGCW